MDRTTGRWTVLSFLAVAVSASGCASASGGTSSRAGGDPNRITYEQLQEDPSADLDTLVQRLRPRWLRSRGTDSFAGPTAPAVFVDGIEQPGRTNALRLIRASDVQEVRYLSASDAAIRFGTDMISGAILVTLR